MWPRTRQTSYGISQTSYGLGLDIVSASVYSMVMNNNRRPTEIYFTTTKSGQPRAYRVSRMQFRSFPMSYDVAKLLVATEQAIDVGSPVWKMR